MLCNREAISLLVERAAYKRVGHDLFVHPLFAEHVAHLLRVRVLQELELMADRLESCLGRPGAVYTSRVIRRLSRQELNSIRASGIIPYPKAVAVLVVPPLNKDPVSKLRPEGSMSASPLVEHKRPTPVSPPLPLSTLHSITTSGVVNDNTLPQARIPFYNGVSLFPARPQRAALHALLSRLLDIETRARYRIQYSPEMPNSTGEVNDRDKKASHAFLLCSDTEISRRADVAAVAIALWRVRMFEGGSCDDSPEGWVKTVADNMIY
jgi:hypothetical protein